MEEIYNLNSKFDFDTLSLAHPVGIQGGAYFTKLTVNNSPLFIQTSSCKTKQGIIKTGKKSYLDLMFTCDDIEIIEWVENLEKKVQEMIYSKREMWFNNDLELEDIEGAFTSPIRVYKSGKFYLVRVYIQSQLPGTNGFTCYDENENIVNSEDITENTLMIPLLEVRGVKFSSRNFQIDIVLRQIMTVEENKFLKKCLIKPKSVNITDEGTSLDEIKNETVNNEISNDETTVNNEEIEVVKETNLEDQESKIICDLSDNTVIDLGEENNVVEEDLEKNKLQDITEQHENGLDNEEDINELKEFEINLDDSLEKSELKLKTEKDIHVELWREARIKAKEVRSLAIAAYLEAKNIKQAYNLNDLEESADELDEILESGHF